MRINPDKEIELSISVPLAIILTFVFTISVSAAWAVGYSMGITNGLLRCGGGL